MTDRSRAESTRRAGIPSVDIVLGDGHAWGFALPRPMPSPVFVRDRDPFGHPRTRIEQSVHIGYRLEICRLADRLVSSCRDDRSGDTETSFFGLAVALLLEAHEIEVAEAESLLDPRVVDLREVARPLIPAVFEHAVEAASPSPR